MKTIDILLKTYDGHVHPLINDLCRSNALERIDHIDMNCGMNYTSHPLFQKMSSYSRLRHSIGTAMIIYHFTHDETMMLAGLVHDIATPVFSHVIDFLNGDYEKQESTEEKTTEILLHDPWIMDVLEQKHIALSAVDDYHIYPIADNETPKLSADRLEYSLSNMVNYGFARIDEAIEYYKDLVISQNEEGTEEIVFQSEDIAALFTRHVLQCSSVYSSDFDRYAMDVLASIVKDAIAQHVITVDDLYHDSEDACIRKLCRDETIRNEWLSFTKLKEVVPCPAGTAGSRIIPAKKRWIDPFVKGKGRISMLNAEIKEQIDLYRNKDYTYAVIEEN